MDLQAGRPNALLKSKSSNKRVKPRVDEKKSKSSGEFTTVPVKKRGVYVEKRVSSPGSEVVSPKVKAPPRSRPGAKPFLDSVLTILSKNTTGTQYPNRSPKMSKIFQPITRASDDEELDLWLLEQSAAVKKPKHKKGEQNPKPKRDQSKEEFKRKVARHVPVEVIAESKIDPGESRQADNVIESNRMHLEKEILDPVTLVNTAAKDEKLYSLFVSLLETVYNAKNDKDAPGMKNTRSVNTNAQKDDLLTRREPRTDASPTDKLFLNSRFAQDSKWGEHELEENIEESTHEFEVDGKSSQTIEFEEVNEHRYSPRSQLLRDEVYKELPERAVTIKSKHELRNSVTSTTSKDTDSGSVKWAGVRPKSVNSETGEVIKNDNTIGVENSIARSVMEGNRLNMEKKTDTTTTSGPEKETKLYSLFVNLLETVYPDLQSSDLFDEASNQSSKLQFEMEVNAAQKVNDVVRQTNEYSQPPCIHCKPREDRHQREKINHRDPNDGRWSYRDDESEAPEHRVRKKVKRRVKHESAEQRALTNPRPLRKKNKKQELLSIIKQQLNRHDDTYKKQVTFYDTLRIMAKNKRKNYDTNFIRCAQDVGDDSEYDPNRRFKKSRAARNTRARPTRYPKAGTLKAPASAGFRYSHSEYKPPNYEAVSRAPPDSDDSYHSLAVYGYDYYWRPRSTKSSTSSGELVDYEVTYNWQTTVGSQCCND